PPYLVIGSVQGGSLQHQQAEDHDAKTLRMLKKVGNERRISLEPVNRAGRTQPPVEKETARATSRPARLPPTCSPTRHRSKNIVGRSARVRISIAWSMRMRSNPVTISAARSKP